MFLFKEDASSEEDKKNLLPVINNLLQQLSEKNISSLNDVGTRTLKKNIFYLKNVLRIGDLKISEGLKSKLATHVGPEQVNQSFLERNFETFLKDQKFKGLFTEIKKEHQLSSTINGVEYTHSVDFIFVYKGKIFLIELDGPTHFTDVEQTQKTPRTQIRDQIIQIMTKKEKRILFLFPYLLISLTNVRKI